MNVKVLYILGTQRGGTTIAGRVAGALPGFAYGGEMHRLWERGVGTEVRCGCGQRLAACPVWSRAMPAALAGTDAALARAWQRAAAPDRASAGKLARLLSGRRGDADAKYAALTGRVYAAFADATNARVVVDASKLPTDAYVAAKSGVDAYVLHVVRDPRGIAYSLARRADAEAHAHPRQVMLASALWAGRNATAVALRHVVGADRFLTLRYEDLAADPSGTMARVACFVGEDAVLPVGTDGTVLLPTAHTPTGEGRFVARPVALSEDRAWVAALGAADFRLTTALTAPMRWRYGYRAARP
ncbi:MAG TPA: sulfotransferase [Acidimicrobiales bacterium]|nr:sulfotransferase [Acidimicrobiales bacterium]